MAGSRPSSSIAAALAGLACLYASGTSASAQTPPPAPETRTMILLDGSGSMWAKLGKDSNKAYLARDIIKQTLGKPFASQLGVTSFGHRRTGDCSDAEVVVPMGAAAVERFAPFLDKFNPKGKGPTVAGLKAAAESLEKGEGRRTLILVTDNADNCRPDTCTVARELKQSMPNLTAHIVALAIPKEEMVNLACLASITGGKVFPVETAAEFTAAIEESFRLAAGPVPPPARAALAPAAPPPVKKEPPPAGPGLRLNALLKSGGEALDAGVRWRVLGPAPASGRDRPVLYDGEEASPTLDVKPGRLLVEVRYGLASAQQEVEVGAQVQTRADLVLNAGIIRIKEATQSAAGASADRAFYTLYQSPATAGERPRAIALSSEASPVYQVPAGNYSVTVQQGLARLERAVAVPAGAVVDVDISLHLGELKLSAAATEGGPALDRMFFLIYEDDPEQPNGLREVARSGASRPEFTLPAGSYHVVARHDQAEVREHITVKPGTRTSKTLNLASGRLTLSSKPTARAGGKLDPGLISYRVERMPAARGAKGEEVMRTSLAEATLSLSAGRYRIESRFGHINAVSAREIEIKAGAAHALVLEHEAGIVTLRIADGLRRQGITDVFWEIADGNGRIVWTSGQPSPRLPLAAGRYTARAEHRERRIEQPFQVTSGEERIIEIEGK
jgi:Ca-activated chloride channel family protein